jgi:O-antigen/teichoic acid export membrane protein
VALLGAYVATAALAVLLATGFVLLAPRLSASFGFLRGDLPLKAVLVGAVVLWNVFALQDAALAAVRKAALVPLENAAFGVLKIVLMVLLARSTGHGVLVAWVVAMVAVVPPVNWLLFKRLLPRTPRTEIPAATALPVHERRKVARYLATDYAACLVGQGASALLPVLVLGALGARASAYFYVAFTIAIAVNALAIALSTSLVVEGAHDERQLDELARQALLRYAGLLLPATLLSIAAAPLLLQPFGLEYVEHASLLLQLLLAGCVPQALVTVYLGVYRLRGRAGRILATQALAFALVLAGLELLMPRLGVVGVGMAWLAGWTVTAATLAPALRRALAGPGQPVALRARKAER